VKNQEEKETAPQTVARYLRQAKALLLLVGQKHQIQTECCEMAHSLEEKPEQKQKRLKALADVQREIDAQVQKMLALEKEEGIGISRLDPAITEQQSLYITAIFLLIMKLSPSLKRHARTIGEIAEVTCSPNEEVHLVRLAFALNGCLRSFVTMDSLSSEGIEEQRVTLTDASYCQALWVDIDDETAARSVVAKIEGYLQRRP
jgi:hypothetical protein